MFPLCLFPVASDDHPNLINILDTAYSVNHQLGMIHVNLQHSKLDTSELIDLVRSPKAGAIVTFTGSTRDSFNGNEVLYLDYEAHVPLATKSLHSICTEAKARWSLLGAACYHRLGRVPISEDSIVIAVSSAHRKEAWQAGEWILEEAKRKTEVWKKETFKETDDTIKAVWKANQTVPTDHTMDAEQ